MLNDSPQLRVVEIFSSKNGSLSIDIDIKPFFWYQSSLEAMVFTMIKIHFIIIYVTWSNINNPKQITKNYTISYICTVETA